MLISTYTGLVPGHTEWHDFMMTASLERAVTNLTFLLLCAFLHVLLQHLIDGEPVLGGFLSMASHGIIQTH